MDYLTIDENGNVSVGTKIVLRQDGSASFAGGNVSVSVEGEVQIGQKLVLGGGSATIEQAGGGDSIHITTADDINLDPGGVLRIGGVPGLTENVTVGGKTLHYTNGILTSVT